VLPDAFVGSMRLYSKIGLTLANHQLYKKLLQQKYGNE